MEPATIHEPVHPKHPEPIESDQVIPTPDAQIIEPSDHLTEKQALSKWLKKIEDFGQKSNRLGEKQHYLRKKAEKAFISVEIYQQLFEEAKKRLENSQRKTENLSKRYEDLGKKVIFFNERREQISLKIEILKAKKEEKDPKKAQILAKKEELKRKKEQLLKKKEENKKRKEAKSGNQDKKLAEVVIEEKKSE